MTMRPLSFPATKPKRARCNHRWRLVASGVEFDGVGAALVKRYQCRLCLKTRAHKKPQPEV